MKRRDYLELINGYKKSLSHKEALLQANYLIKKESYENAYAIVKNYQLNFAELQFNNLTQDDYDIFMRYIEKNI